MTYGYCQAGMSVALRDDTVVLGKLYRSYVSIWGAGGGGGGGGQWHKWRITHGFFIFSIEKVSILCHFMPLAHQLLLNSI